MCSNGIVICICSGHGAFQWRVSLTGYLVLVLTQKACIYRGEFDMTSLMLHALSNKHMERVTTPKGRGKAKEEWSQVASECVSAGGGRSLMTETAGRWRLWWLSVNPEGRDPFCAFHVRDQLRAHGNFPFCHFYGYILVQNSQAFQRELKWLNSLKNSLQPAVLVATEEEWSCLYTAPFPNSRPHFAAASVLS